MANQTPPPPPRPKLLRLIAIVLLALIIVVGLVVLIIWLTLRPKRLVYTIEDGGIHNFNLTNDHLKANFNFVIRAYNPNKKVSVYNDKMDVSVLYEDQIVAITSVSPFFQGHHNVTRLWLHLAANNASLISPVAKDLSIEKSSGGVELEVKVRARIRFKVGSWKSRRRTMKVSCKPVLVHFEHSRSFDRTYCHVDL